MDLLAVVGPLPEALTNVFGQEETGFQINLFWVITQAATFLIFLVILYFVAFRRISGVMEERRTRIEQGLRDADHERIDRERAAQERLAVLAAALQEADDLLARAKKVADETRERDLAETRAQVEQMRERAAADIAAEKERAIAEVRGQVADLALAAAARVVGETMNTERERRLVDEFLAQVGRSDLRDGSRPGTRPS